MIGEFAAVIERSGLVRIFIARIMVMIAFATAVSVLLGDIEIVQKTTSKVFR